MVEAGHAGRAYILVGGTTGMGHAAARELAAGGGRIALIGRTAVRARDIAADLAASHLADVLGFATDDMSLQSTVDKAADALGGLDGIAVTAGPMGETGTFEVLGDEVWLESFETQLMTVVRACRAALPHLRRRGGGRIVTVAATSIRSQKSFLPHYAAMKSAVVSVTKNIAKFAGADNITANCVAPGAIDTEALDRMACEAMAVYGGDRPSALGKTMTDRWGMNVALGRIGRSHEAGELIAFLLSPHAAYLTGALINLDGGTDF